jgi:hypothetical protein
VRFTRILRGVISWLLLGFAMGLRHSLEADHVAAVASLSARAKSTRELVSVAAAWGVGHGLTLLSAAVLWVGAGVSVPDPTQSFVEVAAGLLLVWLGVDLFRQREAGRAHLGTHQHSDGTVHIHLHWRSQWDPRRAPSHEHPHPAHPLRRALIVGAVHGLAGSALIGLLAAGSVHPGRAIAYVGLFAFGATAGMIALSTAISLPLRWPRVREIASLRSCRVALALASIAIGAWISVQTLLSMRVAGAA